MRYVLTILLCLFTQVSHAAMPGAQIGGQYARPDVGSTDFSFTNNLWALYRANDHTNFFGFDCLRDSVGTNHLTLNYTDNPIDSAMWQTNGLASDTNSFAAVGNANASTTTGGISKGDAQDALFSGSYSFIWYACISNNWAGGIMVGCYDAYGWETKYDSGVSITNFLFFGATNGTINCLIMTNQTTFPTNQFFPCAVVYNSTNQTVSYMVNNKWVSGFAPGGITVGPASGIAIAAREYDLSENYQFRLDTIPIFNCALTTNQVATFVNNITSPALALPR